MNRRLVELCNSSGKTTAGSDGKFYRDLRWGMDRLRSELRIYVRRYHKEFPHLVEQWTHFKIHEVVLPIDTGG